jgi:hypothetical protein
MKSESAAFVKQANIVLGRADLMLTVHRGPGHPPDSTVNIRGARHRGQVSKGPVARLSMLPWTQGAPRSSYDSAAESCRGS